MAFTVSESNSSSRHVNSMRKNIFKESYDSDDNEALDGDHPLGPRGIC